MDLDRARRAGRAICRPHDAPQARIRVGCNPDAHAGDRRQHRDVQPDERAVDAKPARRSAGRARAIDRSQSATRRYTRPRRFHAGNARLAAAADEERCRAYSPSLDLAALRPIEIEDRRRERRPVFLQFVSDNYFDVLGVQRVQRAYIHSAGSPASPRERHRGDQPRILAAALLPRICRRSERASVSVTGH